MNTTKSIINRIFSGLFLICYNFKAGNQEKY